MASSAAATEGTAPAGAGATADVVADLLQNVRRLEQAGLDDMNFCTQLTFCFLRHSGPAGTAPAGAGAGAAAASSAGTAPAGAGADPAYDRTELSQLISRVDLGRTSAGLIGIFHVCVNTVLADAMPDYKKVRVIHMLCKLMPDVYRFPPPVDARRDVILKIYRARLIQGLPQHAHNMYTPDQLQEAD